MTVEQRLDRLEALAETTLLAINNNPSPTNNSPFRANSTKK
jgi:hypothetical protein